MRSSQSIKLKIQSYDVYICIIIISRIKLENTRFLWQNKSRSQKKYSKYPTGIEGEKADEIAYKMLEALNYDAYKNTNYIEWTFNNRHLYKWKKNENICDVLWKENRVNLNLKDYASSKVFVKNIETKGKKAEALTRIIHYI